MREEEKRESFLSNFLICCAAIIWSRALYLTYTVVVKGQLGYTPPRIVSLSFPVTKSLGIFVKERHPTLRLCASASLHLRISAFKFVSHSAGLRSRAFVLSSASLESSSHRVSHLVRALAYIIFNVRTCETSSSHGVHPVCGSLLLIARTSVGSLY